MNIFVAEKNTDPLALKTKSSVKLPALHCKTATDMSPCICKLWHYLENDSTFIVKQYYFKSPLFLMWARSGLSCLHVFSRQESSEEACRCKWFLNVFIVPVVNTVTASTVICRLPFYKDQTYFFIHRYGLYRP